MGPTPIYGDNYPSGIGYIVLPSDVGREEYISICYKTKTVSIKIEDGTFYKRVSIPEYLLSFATFPEKKGELGSPVFFASEPIRNQLYIISVYDAQTDNISDLTETQFKTRRVYKENSVEVIGSPKEGFLGMKVDTGPLAGEIYLHVITDKNNGKIRLECSGNIESISHKSTLLQSYDGLEIKTTKEDDKEKFTSFRQSYEQTDIETKKLVINEGDEPFMLGNKWKAFMKDFITEVSNITTTTALGTQPIINKALVLKFQSRLDEMLSEEAFLKK